MIPYLGLVSLAFQVVLSQKAHRVKIWKQILIQKRIQSHQWRGDALVASTGSNGDYIDVIFSNCFNYKIKYTEWFACKCEVFDMFNPFSRKFLCVLQKTWENYQAELMVNTLN